MAAGVAKAGDGDKRISFLERLQLDPRIFSFEQTPPCSYFEG